MSRVSGLILFMLLFLNQAIAAPITDEAIPEPLKQWVPWVMYGQEDSQCSFVYKQFDNKRCYWISNATFDLSNRGGSFQGQWSLSYPQWVPLPGRADQWPQNVKANGLVQAVVARSKKPFLYLKTGQYRVTGSYLWNKLPQSLSLPPDVGLVSLRIENKPQAFPHIDKQGLLWLRENKLSQVEKQQDAVSITVHRKLLDAIPVSVETRIELNIAGNERELLLTGALLDDFIAMQLISDLPARLEADGQLRVQVKAGQWQIIVQARAPKNQLTFTLPQTSSPWPNEEVWVFAAQPELRQVTLSGAPTIDPKNTRIPKNWHLWPTYRLQADTKLVLEVKQRGGSAKKMDQLTLQRTWWLDFDGSGYSLQDKINGQVFDRFRLPMNADITLGRVSINGEDQFITHLEGEEKQGIELRDGYLNLVADSRWQGKGHLPATGWDADFQQVSAKLNLPPGWRLLAATGVDKSSGSWFAHWTLLDLFLLFIIAASFSHLWGKQFGVLALVAIIVMYHEQGAPIAVWLNVLAASALLKALPQGVFRQWVQRYFYASILIVMLIALPFMVQQARQAIHPQLEFSYYNPPDSQSITVTGSRIKRGVTEELHMMESVEMPSSMTKLKKPTKQIRQELSLYDSKTKVQTGPGVPNWHWRSSNLNFSGPVDKDQSINLWLLSPWQNRLLAFSRIALLMIMIAGVLGWRPKINFKAITPMLLTGILIMAIGIPNLVMAQERSTIPDSSNMPDKALLDELKQRLLAAPDCLPNCAESAAMQITLTDKLLLIRQQIDTAKSVLVPLPGQRDHWTPQHVIVDGKNTSNLHHDQQGQLWLSLPAGRHDVVIRGALSSQAVIQLMLPIKPHHLTIKQGKHWSVQGNTKAGHVTDLVLKRQQLDVAKSGDNQILTATSLPPFLKVERQLHFGRQWELVTRVTRVTPADSLVQLVIPLLNNEVVTDSKVMARNGVMPVRLKQGQVLYQWRSLLTEKANLILLAQNSNSWVEHWSLTWSPIWHVDWTGLPLIETGKQGITWRPWAGEQLNLTIQRPSGDVGQTLTMDQSHIEIQAGQRSSDITLQMKLRSSLGQQHHIQLPKGAQLTSVNSDGRSLGLELVDGQLSLPIHPGAQNIDITWRQQTDASDMLLTTPNVDLGLLGVNHEISLKIPQDRWILAVGGPNLGPAVLVWGMLLVLILIAIPLGQLSLTPLKSKHWALLLIGLTQSSMAILVIVVGWLLAFGWRLKRPFTAENRFVFNVVQVSLGIFTLVALVALLFAIKSGLLGQPDMQIIGNGSYFNYLHWYQDRTDNLLPQAWVLSIPLFVYRILMLLWALWLAFALLGWLRWAWQCFSRDGIWRHVNINVPNKKTSQ